MSEVRPLESLPRARLGWMLLALVSGFVALAGAYVLVVPVDADFFARTTGVAWSDFEAQHASVASNLERSGRLTGAASGAFGALALAITLVLLRRGDRGAWRALWVVPLALGAFTLLFILDGVWMLAAFYGALSLAAAAGLLLATRGLTGSVVANPPSGPAPAGPER
jgi:hypothetical protein